MTTLLARHAEILVTMDDERREIPDGAVLVEDGMITAVGSTEDLPSEADTVLDLRGQIVLPGMVNTHHHLDQTLTRNLPQAQNINLFPWLRAHYEIWGKRTPEATRGSTLIGLAATCSRTDAGSTIRSRQRPRSASGSTPAGDRCPWASRAVASLPTTAWKTRTRSSRTVCG
jgi:hypothetical protein